MVEPVANTSTQTLGEVRWELSSLRDAYEVLYSDVELAKEAVHFFGEDDEDCAEGPDLFTLREDLSQARIALDRWHQDHDAQVAALEQRIHAPEQASISAA
jgi:hypothetical protein